MIIRPDIDKIEEDAKSDQHWGHGGEVVRAELRLSLVRYVRHLEAQLVDATGNYEGAMADIAALVEQVRHHRGHSATEACLADITDFVDINYPIARDRPALAAALVAYSRGEPLDPSVAAAAAAQLSGRP